MEQNEMLENVEVVNESNGKSTDKKWFSELGLRYFILSIIIIVTQIGMSFVIGKFFKDNESVSQYQLLIGMLPMYIIGVPIGCYIIAQQKGTKIEKKDFPFKNVLACFLIGFAFMYVGNIVGSLMSSTFAAMTSTKANTAIVDVVIGTSSWQNFLIVVICAPIVEEIMFRKLLTERLIKYGEKLAIIVSAIAFGLYHGNITQFVYATLIGLVLAYVYLKSGNILYNIFIHMLINFNGSILSVWVLKKSGLLEFVSAAQDPAQIAKLESILMENIGGLLIYCVYAFCLFAIVIAGFIIFFINLKKISFEKGEITLEKGTAFKTVVGNAGVILFLIFCFVLAITNLIAVQ